MPEKNEISTALLALLERLQAFSVNWSPKPDEYVLGRDRAAEKLDDADVSSSLIRSPWGGPTDRHVIALDIDYPVHVVPSSTEGHSHLYIDVPGGIPHQGYMALVSLLGHLGVIEEGYANVSMQRGHTDLRLPWVKKGHEPGRNREHDAEKAVF